ncbi:DNA-binding FadR family transcriptional regulator [Herbaspirillum sp. Sphag1AN]|uniref:FadR/GntR family transcriptional regulator n=1 Tax=unclassified Herbaspirillum TaxID=2624150 RepID=UPI0016103A95|nr:MULTISPECIES: FadR/GntR family transcriptional regulator [unclassified Herbaspirillum]MBB3213315.1 DNA-binding FadR family transcriptional regulator [Herbaspirillum sp. Sphag1AN]MBB3246641.1 DNA-binding FadR family transcriptional regulator [Herbaspirillum sp. Sphag64]
MPASSRLPSSQETSTATTLADRVTQTLGEQIRRGEFPPESRLPSENALTERFQVSRTVIREAISRLKSEGMVGSRRGSGTVVLAPDNAAPFRLKVEVGEARDAIETVLRVIELRRGVEGEMAALAAQRASASEHREITDALAAIDQAVAAGRDGVAEDFAFHSVISVAAHNPLYTSLLQYLSQFLQAAIRVARINEARRDDFSQQVRQEHAAIAAAIAAGDPAEARAAALQHMENSAQRIEAADREFWASEGGKAVQHLRRTKGL